MTAWVSVCARTGDRPPVKGGEHLALIAKMEPAELEMLRRDQAQALAYRLEAERRLRKLFLSARRQ